MNASKLFWVSGLLILRYKASIYGIELYTYVCSFCNVKVNIYLKKKIKEIILTLCFFIRICLSVNSFYFSKLPTSEWELYFNSMNCDGEHYFFLFFFVFCCLLFRFCLLQIDSNWPTLAITTHSTYLTETNKNIYTSIKAKFLFFLLK